MKKFSYTQTYSISLQKARKNTNLSLNPIRNPDTHDAPLKITYHDFSTHFYGVPKNINFCKNRIRYPYTSPSRKPAKKRLFFWNGGGGKGFPAQGVAGRRDRFADPEHCEDDAEDDMAESTKWMMCEATGPMYEVQGLFD